MTRAQYALRHYVLRNGSQRISDVYRGRSKMTILIFTEARTSLAEMISKYICNLTVIPSINLADLLHFSTIESLLLF